MPDNVLYHLELEVPRTVTAALSALESATGRPRDAVLCTAVALTLSRYGPDKTVRLLTPGADTPDPGAAAPTLAEIAWEPGATVRELISRVAHGLDIPRKLDVPLANVRSRLAARDILRTDSAPVLTAVLQPRRVQIRTLENLEAIVTAGFADCMLVLCDGERGSRLAVRVRHEALQAELALKFATHVLHALPGMLAALEHPPARCSAISDSEQKELLKSGRGPVQDFPFDGGLKGLFERTARAHAHSVAVIDEDDEGNRRTVSYDELNQWANAIAAALHRGAVEPLAPVVLFLPRSIDSVAALVGIVKSGATYVPVDVSYPDAYVRRIIEETRPAAILTDSYGADRLAEHTAGPALLTVPGLDVASERYADPADRSNAHSICLTLYTSGSTGRPKGVTHRQRQVLNRLHWMWEAYPLGDQEVLCQRSPLGVLPSLWELLGGLLRGLPTAVASDAVTRDPARLARFIAKHDVTRLTLPPSAFLRLVSTRGVEVMLSSLQYVTIGGEMLDPEFIATFARALPGCVMIEDYGCTETNTVLHYSLAPGETCVRGSPGGKPIANIGAYVLDRYGQVAPRGAIGELTVAGVSLAAEYLGSPGEYARRFVANTIDPVVGELLYYTGDLAYVRPDGSIKLIGRSDHQLKVRGMRVEPSEVEAVLQAHDGIAACCVTAAIGNHGGGELVAYIVPQADRCPTASEIVTFACGHLPSFMVPTRVIHARELPRLSNGKLDRRAMAQRASRLERSSSPPVAGGVLAQVRTVLSHLLDRDLDESSDALEFQLHGLDSALTVEYARRLTDDLGVEITPTMLYAHYTLAALAAHIAEHPCGMTVSPARTAAWAVVGGRSTNPSDTLHAPVWSSDIAIIGMACRFPGADSPAQFWSHLAQGRSSVVEIPESRWSVGTSDGETNPPIGRWAALLDDIQTFDPYFFGISRADAIVMDPQIRIGLEEAWRAFEDAGYSPLELSAKETGVFVGMRKGDMEQLLDRSAVAPSVARLLGNDPAMLAARIAARLDLNGPGVTVDTACSSSLTAVHLACQSLTYGECEIALAGGVFIALSRDFLITTGQLGILSPTGRCRAFDRDADGTVQGEGAGFVVMKRARDAVRDGDDIRAVIKGSALNQDGCTNGIGAPNPRSQAAVQQRVYRRFGIDPLTISYVEAHGTGTQIGDPIEIDALTRAFGGPILGRPFCGLGSVKTNIGHLNEAAGIAGLIKVVLCLRHRQLPPSLNFDYPCPGISVPGSPFYVNTRLQTWEPMASRAPRRAAVNSFGLSGTNVHCVLEEAPSPRPLSRARPSACLFLLSARTASALDELVARFHTWIAAEGRNHDLLDISFTLLVGRERHPEAMSVVASTHDELTGALAAASSGTSSGGHGKETSGAPFDGDATEFGQHVLSRLVSGELDDLDYSRMLGSLGMVMPYAPTLDVSSLFPCRLVRRVPIPTYRFDKVVCWPPGWALSALAHDESMHDSADGSSGPYSIRTLLLRTLESTFGLDQGSIKDADELGSYGYDSVETVELKARLEESLGTDVPIRLLTHMSSFEILLERLEEHMRSGA